MDEQTIVLFDTRRDRLHQLEQALSSDHMVSTFDTSATMACIRRRPTALVLADWRQSGGARILNHLSDWPEEMRPPVVLLDDLGRAEDYREMVERALRLKALAFIPRPIESMGFCANLMTVLDFLGLGTEYHRVALRLMYYAQKH